MFVSNRLQVSDLHAVRAPADGDAERKTVAILSEVLRQSIKLRDSYKNARSQTVDIQYRGLRQMFERHYKEQLQLVDVLTDRIRTLGGARQLFASNYLQGTRLACALRGHKAVGRLLCELIDAHEAVLNTGGQNGSGLDDQWSRDFAFGQVVLTNDAQRANISNELAKSDPRHRAFIERADALLD
jgi:starvation-inducible DNA-binding protein